MDSQLMWTTRDGRKMRLSEMTHEHLANTIAMLERRETVLQRSLNAAWVVSASFIGEQALIEVDKDIDYMEDELVTTRHLLGALKGEKWRREKLAQINEYERYWLTHPDPYNDDPIMSRFADEGDK